MIPPLENPPHRKTSHGATMSPRLSRLYTWLQANQVALTDFSTDECVKRELPKLISLKAELLAMLEGDPIELLPLMYLMDLAADLANIMKRLPENRVT